MVASTNDRSEGLRRALGADERGFSMVEVMVVTAVIGLLSSLGLATFAGASDRAQGRAVEVELRTALDAALVLAIEGGGRFVVDDAPIGPLDLAAEEPALAFAGDGTAEAIGIEVSSDASTIWLDKVDGGGTRRTLVAVSGRGLRFCTVEVPSDCALEDDVAVVEDTPASTVTTATTVASSSGGGGNGNGGAGRQDGGTPASDVRQNRR